MAAVAAESGPGAPSRYVGWHRQYTQADLARDLGVSRATAHRYAARWHGHSPYRAQPLTVVDLMVARAWFAISSGGQPNQYSPHGREMCELAEGAIRRRPRRWVAVSLQLGADTFDTAEAAARAWAKSGATGITLVDVGPVPEGEAP